MKKDKLVIPKLTAILDEVAPNTILTPIEVIIEYWKRECISKGMEIPQEFFDALKSNVLTSPVSINRSRQEIYRERKLNEVNSDRITQLENEWKGELGY